MGSAAGVGSGANVCHAEEAGDEHDRAVEHGVYIFGGSEFPHGGLDMGFYGRFGGRGVHVLCDELDVGVFADCGADALVGLDCSVVLGVVVEHVWDPVEF